MENLLPKDLLVKCVAFKKGDQWIGVCINFDLAVQGDSFADVKKRLDSQIKGYLIEALSVDKEHASYLLHREAPFRFKFLFWVLQFLDFIQVKCENKKDYETALPLQLA